MIQIILFQIQLWLFQLMIMNISSMLVLSQLLQGRKIIILAFRECTISIRLLRGEISVLVL